METTEQLHQVKTEGKEFIALWQISTPNSLPSKNIFLSHGTFSDRKIILSIAQFLAKKNYTCWIMEWRNHGASSPSNKKINFENIGIDDYPIIFNYLFKTLKINNLSCITHSGAGICLSIFLATHPTYISKINRIVMFGCQAHGAAFNFKNRAKILLGKYVNALLEELQKIKIPILSICAKGDDFIAPKEGCELFLNAFKNPKNKLLFCSVENGFKEDYNHSRVLQSRNAAVEIWPIALDWLETE